MHPLVELAKNAVETYIKEGRIILPPLDLDEDYLSKKSGVFVTIKKDGKLRGCIGTYLPTQENIAEEVIRNAISAATQDYRFGPVEKEELPFLSYTVYILHEPQLVEDKSELNPQKYGIIVKSAPYASLNGKDVVFNGRSPVKTGLLLPGLKGIDTADQQIFIACQKAGIDPKKEKIIIYRFTTEKYGEQ
ncbi:AmmeMemoRadiSam system protein A [bacterium]|nr:AmmeMemoRadiSam system protein A [bacterium]